MSHGAELLLKAFRKLNWARADLEDMEKAGLEGNQDAFEKAFSSSLGSINVAADALLDASNLLDSGVTRKTITDARGQKDELLHYLQMARNGDVHHVLTWDMTGSELALKVFDDTKRMRVVRLRPDLDENKALLMFIYGAGDSRRLDERIGAGDPPDAILMDIAGVVLGRPVRRTFLLGSFEYTNTMIRKRPAIVKVDPPTHHLGASIPPFALIGIFSAIKFYRGQLARLAKQANIDVPEVVLPKGYELEESRLRDFAG
jgi:hypothetical protein